METDLARKEHLEVAREWFPFYKEVFASGYAKAYAKGYAKGYAKAEKKALRRQRAVILLILQKKFGAVPPGLRARLKESADLERLASLTVTAGTATSPDDVVRAISLPYRQ